MKDVITNRIEGDKIIYSKSSGRGVPEEILSIQESYSIENKTAQMKLAGDLSSEFDHELKDEMLLFLACGMSVVLDFSDVSYFSNSCQDSIIDVGSKKKEFGISGTFEIINVPEEIYADLKRKHFTLSVKTRMKGAKV